MPRPYCPKRGDIVWLVFTPQAGHRPALTLSPKTYNKKVGLAIFCPVTTKIKNYPFEVPVPSGLKASGVVLSDQVKNLDWRARNAKFCCEVPESTLSEVLGKLGVLLSE